MNEKLGQEPAFPALEHNETGYGDQITLCFNGEINTIPFTKGMNKRFYAACAAMQGILSNPAFSGRDTKIPNVAIMAFAVADELLKQEGAKS